MPGSVIVTGASGGLGPAVARRLAKDSWRVVAIARDRGPVEPGIGTVSADLMEPDGVAAAVAAATGDGNHPLRAVVNLVGGFDAPGRVHETPVERFEAQLRLNLRPTYLVTAAALPHLIAAGGGSVVCVGSRASLRPFAGAAGYITAKAALLGLVDALAAEYLQFGVRVNAVVPSVIDTPANRASQPGVDWSKWVRPEQVADVIGYLISDASAVTSGAHIPVYGRA